MWGSLAPEAMMIGRGPDQGYRRCDAEIKATWAACADHAAAARASTVPKMLLHATEDVFCSNSTFESFVETVPEPRTIVRVEGASHFDVRRPLAAALAEWGGAVLDK